MGTSWRAAGLAGAVSLLLGVGAFNAGAWAQASVGLDCASSDICGVDVTTDPGTATPLGYQWSFAIPPGMDLRFNRNCDNKAYCGFWCYHHEGTLTVSITVKDATGAILGTDTQSVGCTQQPEA